MIKNCHPNPTPYETTHNIADVDYHIAIAEMSRNNVFIFALSAICNLLTQDLNHLVTDREICRLFIAHHHHISAAIAAHNPAQAGRTMRDHLQCIVEQLQKF